MCMAKWIENEYDRLYEAYLTLASDWVDFIKPENDRRETMKRSQLLIKVRRRGPRELYAVWTYRRFFKTRAGWKAYGYEIRKGRGHETPADRIRRHAIGWELDMALEFERRLARLREQQEALGKISRAYSRYLKLREADEE